MKGDGGVKSSKDISSLIPDDDPRGKKLGGGGVRLGSSVNVSQNSLPFEFRIACCWKLFEGTFVSSIIASSGIPSKDSDATGPRFGDEWVVDIEGCRGSRSKSLSLVCLTTSASRRTSVSTGALSSANAARIRANPFVLGCQVSCEGQKMTKLLPAYFLSESLPAE